MEGFERVIVNQESVRINNRHHRVDSSEFAQARSTLITKDER
jgi:hypothetical protein